MTTLHIMWHNICSTKLIFSCTNLVNGDAWSHVLVLFLVSVVLSGQYRDGKAIPVVMSAGGNVITIECETFSDTNLTVYSS